MITEALDGTAFPTLSYRMPLLHAVSAIPPFTYLKCGFFFFHSLIRRPSVSHTYLPSKLSLLTFSLTFSFPLSHNGFFPH